MEMKVLFPALRLSLYPDEQMDSPKLFRECTHHGHFLIRSDHHRIIIFNLSVTLYVFLHLCYLDRPKCSKVFSLELALKDNLPTMLN